MKRTRLSFVVASLLFTVAIPVQADVYPSRPVRFVVPFPPGGGTDLLARAVAARLSESLGRQVVVDNRAGAAGNIGTDVVAKAPPDGHTMLLAYIGPVAVSPSLNRQLPYDPVKDFDPVCLMATIPLVMVVHPSLPAKSVKQVIALAKAKPGEMTYGSAGNGSAQQLAGELFKLLTHTRIIDVPYKGGAPATTDLIGGQINLLFTGALGVFPHVQAGRLRALAVTSTKRLTSAPHLPTVAEAGVPGFEVVSWNGVLVPAGTPKAVVSRLNADIVKALKLPDVAERLNSQGLEIVASTPEEFGRFIAAEIAKWSKVVHAAGIRAQ